MTVKTGQAWRGERRRGGGRSFHRKTCHEGFIPSRTCCYSDLVNPGMEDLRPRMLRK